MKYKYKESDPIHIGVKIIAFLGIIYSFGILYFFAGYLDYELIDDWKESQANITKVHYSGRHNSFEYTYQVGDQRYVSSRITMSNHYSSSPLFQSLKKKHSKNEPIKIYISTEEPSKSVHTLELQNEEIKNFFNLVLMAIPLLFPYFWSLYKQTKQKL